MTRSLAERSDTQRRRRNNSSGGNADLGPPMALQWVDGIGTPAAAQSDVVTALTQRLNQLTQEVSASRQRSEQLQAVLEKRSWRLQQLIGERDRLVSLLAGRDAELQRLNRELGALTACREPGQVRSAALATAARTLLDRFQRARKRIASGKILAPRPQRPAVGVHETRLVPWLKHRPPKDVIAVVVFGLSEGEIERALQAVEHNCAGLQIAPLLLTDNNSFELFRNRRVLFEFLPPPSEQQRVASELDWRLYTLRRLALIRRKWRPSRVVAFGRRATEMVQLWLDSPFEETPIPATLKGGSAGNAPWAAALPSVR